MLRTKLAHLDDPNEMKKVLQENENVMVCCGRMGPMCIPVYVGMEQLQPLCPHVKLYDQDFDGPAAGYIRRLPECARFMGLPFTIYFKNGKVAAATTSIQSKKQVADLLDQVYGAPTR
jgi:thioredoxin 1